VGIAPEPLPLRLLSLSHATPPLSRANLVGRMHVRAPPLAAAGMMQHIINKHPPLHCVEAFAFASTLGMHVRHVHKDGSISNGSHRYCRYILSFYDCRNRG
jgi:hypothetical protein